LIEGYFDGGGNNKSVYQLFVEVVTAIREIGEIKMKVREYRGDGCGAG
jgi:hypothetical protein